MFLTPGQCTRPQLLLDRLQLAGYPPGLHVLGCSGPAAGTELPIWFCLIAEGQAPQIAGVPADPGPSPVGVCPTQSLEGKAWAAIHVSFLDSHPCCYPLKPSGWTLQMLLLSNGSLHVPDTCPSWGCLAAMTVESKGRGHGSPGRDQVS